MFRLISELFGRKRSSGSENPRCRKTAKVDRRFCPAIEVLEDRLAPATLTPTYIDGYAATTQAAPTMATPSPPPAVLSVPSSSLGNSPNAVYVENLYVRLLHRPADSGASYWVGLLNQGVTRSTVIADIESGREYLSDVVTEVYQYYLNRAPDSAGLNGWVNALEGGSTMEQVIRGITASPEFYQAQGHGTNAGFVTALYQDILNRPPDSAGYNAWLQALDGGSMTRVQVAYAFLRSPEYHGNLVNSYYQDFLGRPADTDGLAGWVQNLQSGRMTDQDVLAATLGSPEGFGDWSVAPLPKLPQPTGTIYSPDPTGQFELPIGDWYSRAEADLSEIIGKTENEARLLLQTSGWTLRVTSRDGTNFTITDDLMFSRVDVTIEKGIVKSFSIG